MSSIINNNRKRTFALAFSAIASSVSVLILYLGSVIEVLDLSCGAIASLLVIWTVMELGKGWAFLVWGVSSALSLLLLPNKFIAIFYFLFCGIYPIIKSFFEKLKTVLSWCGKVLYFNLILFAVIWLSKNILMLNDSELDFTIPIIILGNITFIIYDIALTKLVTVYTYKLRKRLKIDRLFKNK